MYRIEDSEYCKLHTKKICYLCNKPINFKDKYCYLHDPKKKLKNINFCFKTDFIYEFINNYIDYTNLNSNYKLKIFINKIPIIIEHTNYTINLTKDNIINKYFDIKQFFYNIYLLFRKNNIIINYENLQMTQKSVIHEKFKKNNPNNKILLPPLPVQTNDELLLLEFNVIYNNIDEKQYKNILLENHELQNENSSLKTKFEKISDVNIKNVIYMNKLITEDRFLKKEIKELNDKINNKKDENTKPLIYISENELELQFKYNNLKKDMKNQNENLEFYIGFHNNVVDFINGNNINSINELQEIVNRNVNIDNHILEIKDFINKFICLVLFCINILDIFNYIDDFYNKLINGFSKLINHNIFNILMEFNNYIIKTGKINDDVYCKNQFIINKCLKWPILISNLKK